MRAFHRLLPGVALAALSIWFVPLSTPLSAAAAQSADACHASLHGTITQVRNSNEFAMQAADARIGNIDVYISGARIHANGLSLRPGLFAGVYGCYGPGSRSFKASEVTLAASQAAYQNSTNADRDNDRDYARSPADVDNCHVSMFGTIDSLRGPNAFMLQALHSPFGTVYVDYRSARMNANGLSVRPGVFAGLYGCVEQDGRVFKPNEATLAPSESAYAAASHVVTLVGTIDEIHRGWIGVRTPYNGHIHVYTSQSGLRTGERVSIRGPFNPRTGVVNAANVAAR